MSYKAPISIYPITSALNDVVKQAAREMDEIVVSSVLQVGVEVDKAELVRALQYDRDQYESGASDKFLEMMKQGYRLLYKARNLSQDTPSLFSCSKCGESCWDTYTWDHSDINYCPHCGAEIEKEDANEG